jgi:hypothetical protein
MLSFDLSERTVLRGMRKAPWNPQPAKRWAAFLSNHRDAIAAMDFFTVPTLTFGMLYCFFVISHVRRRVLHFNATQHPTGAWVSQATARGLPIRFRSQVSDSLQEKGTNDPKAGILKEKIEEWLPGHFKAGGRKDLRRRYFMED